MTRNEWKSAHRTARIQSRRARQQEHRALRDGMVTLEAELDRAMANVPAPPSASTPLPSGRRLAALGAALTALMLLSVILHGMTAAARQDPLIKASAPASQSAAPPAETTPT